MVPDNTPSSRVALFPISVDSAFFRTSTVIPALQAIGRKYKSVLFLVADSLQIYNKLWSAAQRSDLGIALEDFERLRQSYLTERMKWIARLCRQMHGPHPCDWTVRSSYDYMDAAFWRIYQRLLVLRCMSDELRKDIGHSALEHTRRQKQLKFSKESKRLSEAYILEELVLNIRVRVFERIDSEFYLGEYPKPLLQLYASRYGLGVGALAGRNTNDMEFRFFNWRQNDGDHGDWKQVNRVRNSKVKGQD
jgi:hypothetical protein